jgi:hypothetical protein
MAHAGEIGFPEGVIERGTRAVEGLPAGLVYAGFSLLQVKKGQAIRPSCNIIWAPTVRNRGCQRSRWTVSPSATPSAVDHGVAGRVSLSPSTTMSTRSWKNATRSRIFGFSGIGSG